MRNELAKIAFVVFGLAITIFLSCADTSSLTFPSEEEEKQKSYCVVESIETCFSSKALEDSEYSCSDLLGTFKNSCPADYEKY